MPALAAPPALRCTAAVRRLQFRTAAAAASVTPSPPASVKLFYNPQSRSQMLDWLLKELGAEGNVERVSLDMRSKEHKQPAFLRIHPFGQVPALEAGGVSVFESGACLLYIADKWGGLDTPEQRGAAASWVVWANATFWPAVVGGSLTQKLPTLAGPVNELLSRQPFVAGDKWGVADCAVASYLHYAVVFVGVDWKPWPAIVAYLQRTSERPAFKATVGSE